MKLYTASELAEIYQVHPKTIYKLGRQGKLKRVKVGRAVRFAEPKMERSGYVKREIKTEPSL